MKPPELAVVLGVFLQAQVIVSSQLESVDVTESYDGRFHGVLSFVATEDINGWEVKINFSKPVGHINVC